MIRPLLILMFFLSSDAFAWGSHEEECENNPAIKYKQEDIDGYNFALKIHQALQAQNLDLLLDLFGGQELADGPRISQIKKAEFSDLFEQDYVDAILDEKPPCRKFNYEGWMLNNGKIWFKSFYYDFQKDDSTFIAMNVLRGVNDIETLDLLSGGWFHKEKLIHPETFITMSMSGDFFQDIAEQKKITDAKNFYTNPGQYYGSKIKLSEQMKNSWNGSDLLLSVPIEYFNDKDSSNGEYNSDLEPCAKFNEGSRGETCYSLVAEIPLSHCQQLAPNTDAECVESYMVYVGDWGGGSFGFDYTAAIYALFKQDNNFFMAPLKYLGHYNSGLNYLDTLQ